MVSDFLLVYSRTNLSIRRVHNLYEIIMSKRRLETYTEYVDNNQLIVAWSVVSGAANDAYSISCEHKQRAEVNTNKERK